MRNPLSACGHNVKHFHENDSHTNTHTQYQTHTHSHTRWALLVHRAEIKSHFPKHSLIPSARRSAHSERVYLAPLLIPAAAPTTTVAAAPAKPHGPGSYSEERQSACSISVRCTAAPAGAARWGGRGGGLMVQARQRHLQVPNTLISARVRDRRGRGHRDTATAPAVVRGEGGGKHPGACIVK